MIADEVYERRIAELEAQLAELRAENERLKTVITGAAAQSISAHALRIVTEEYSSWNK